MPLSSTLAILLVQIDSYNLVLHCPCHLETFSNVMLNLLKLNHIQKVVSRVASARPLHPPLLGDEKGEVSARG